MGIFYPSCLASLQIRFDEAYHVRAEVENPESVASFLAQSREELTPGFVGPVAPPQPRPLVVQTGDDILTQIANRIPKMARVELPGYTIAGNFSLTFDYRELPIDPMLIRACGVEIYLDSVSPDDFAEGMVQSTAATKTARKSILKPISEPSDPGFNLAIVGLVDNWTVDHETSEVKMDGRDLRGIFLDSPIDERMLKGHVDLKKPIDQVVRNILESHPRAQQMNVEVQPDDWFDDDGKKTDIPSPFLSGGLTRVRLSADGNSPHSAPMGGSSNLNFWDVIVYYCATCGAIPYFVGRQLRIRPGRSIDLIAKMQGFDPVGHPSPFRRGQSRILFEGNPPSLADEFRIRKIVYGRGIEKLNFERKLSGIKARLVEVRSVDTSSDKRGNKTIIGRWPTSVLTASERKLRGAKTTNVSPSGSVSDTDVLRFKFAGIRDKKRLQQIAHDLFEQIMHAEMGGSCTTKDMASFGANESDPVELSGNQDPDLMRLRPGDPVEILVDTRALSSRSPLVSVFTDQSRFSFQEAVKEITDRIGDENLARVLVASSRGGITELNRFFRVANVKFDWSDKGISISFDFHNYVGPRSQVGQSTDENTTPVKKSAASRRSGNLPGNPGQAVTPDQIRADRALQKNKKFSNQLLSLPTATASNEGD